MEAADYRTTVDGIALQMIHFSHLEELTQEAEDAFIRKVTVYHDRRVEIEWNYDLGEA